MRIRSQAPPHGHDGQVEHGQGGDGEQRELPHLHAGHEEHQPPGKDQGEGGAEVRLDEDEEAEPPEQQQGREEPLELVDPVAAPLDVIGEEDDDRELGQLRRLEAEGPESHPAVGVVQGAQEEHHDQAQGRGDRQRVDDGRPAQGVVVHPERRHHGGQADDAPHRLPGQEVVGGAVALLGEGRAGAPHHQQAEAEQGQGDGEEGEVGAEPLSHRVPSLRRRGRRPRRRTSSLKARPRSA